MNKLTCVSGYWRLHNKHGDQFTNWFNTSLKINCPYVFFSDKETIEMIKPYREGLPTVYIELNIEDFVTYPYKDRMITDTYHCPSVLLNVVWNEKIFLIQKALDLNPFQSDFFCWVDAGICTYRKKAPPSIPFPNINKLNELPTNKFIYTSSEPYNPDLVQKTNYYHHVSGTYMLHKNIIPYFVNLYYQYFTTLVDKNNIWTEQVILTHIFKNHQYLFYKFCDGYGELYSQLY
jgi:hypothetical protein